MTPSRTSHLVLPLTPIDPIRYSWLCGPCIVVRQVRDNNRSQHKYNSNARSRTKRKMESAPTHLGGIWPTADADHYSHTAALFAQIAFITVI